MASVSKNATDLLSYLSTHPPDLHLRQYRKSLGLKTSDAEVGEPSIGRMLVVPGPPQSAILQHKDGEDDQTNKDQHISASLVSPILWIPGVLRACGSWAVAMKDTSYGDAYITKGEDLLASKDNESSATNIPRNSEYEKEIAGKNLLIAQLQQSVARQKNLNVRIMRRFKEHTAMCLRALEKARSEEQERHNLELEKRVKSSEQRVRHLKEDLTTTKTAMKVRVQRAYAQDNFLTMYSKAMLTVKEQAKEIAKHQIRDLENQVGILERRIVSDTEYKKILQRRTEAAEVAAEKRWEEAENKIPLLEDRIIEERMKSNKTRLSVWAEKTRNKRLDERLGAELFHERESKNRILHEQEELKRELRDVTVKWRNQKLRADDLKRELERRTRLQHEERQSGTRSSLA